MSQIHQIIRKYFHQTYSPKVRGAFTMWLKDKKQEEDIDNALFEIWNELNILSDYTTESSFDRLQHRLSSDQNVKKHSISIYRKCLRIASILLIPILSFTGAYLYIKNSTPIIESVDWAECFVPNGEIRTIVLPDSTTVKINSGSVLIYPKAFNGKTRDLYLNGEASFAVTRNERKPFIVKTLDMDIEVLGTVFNVSSYNSDDNTSTTLESGKVNVRMKNNSNESFILEPNEQIMFNRITRETDLRNVNIENVVAWQKGYIVVERLTIGEISRMIERKYDVTVHIVDVDKYKNERITAKFMNSENLDECLFVLKQLVSNMKYKIDGSKVYVY